LGPGEGRCAVYLYPKPSLLAEDVIIDDSQSLRKFLELQVSRPLPFQSAPTRSISSQQISWDTLLGRLERSTFRNTYLSSAKVIMGEIGEFWKNTREYQKRRERETPPRRRCWDWIIVSGNCHYAKNRSSFKVYRRVGRMIRDATGAETYIAGVGTVELNVRASSKKGSPTRSLVLENVLHVPDAVCNGFSIGLGI
jgi:hypothetical protein